jgi:hypothetical protein
MRRCKKIGLFAIPPDRRLQVITKLSPRLKAAQDKIDVMLPRRLCRHAFPP